MLLFFFFFFFFVSFSNSFVKRACHSDHDVASAQKPCRFYIPRALSCLSYISWSTIFLLSSINNHLLLLLLLKWKWPRVHSIAPAFSTPPARLLTWSLFCLFVYFFVYLQERLFFSCFYSFDISVLSPDFKSKQLTVYMTFPGPRDPVRDSSVR